MGRGDKRSKKGKIFRGSFGNNRMKASKLKKDAATAAAAAAANPATTTEEVTPA